MPIEARTDSAGVGPAVPLIHLLRQLAALIRDLDDEDYCAEHARGLSGTIGGHVRHCLDHVGAFVAGVALGRVNYDVRKRGTLVESQRATALAAIVRLEASLVRLPWDTLSRPLVVPTALDAHGTNIVAHSTIGRELSFVISHTIHHFAVLALLVRDLDVTLPARFGYAPSTPATSASSCQLPASG